MDISISSSSLSSIHQDDGITQVEINEECHVDFNQLIEDLKKEIQGLKDELAKSKERESDLLVAVQASERLREALEVENLTLKESQTLNADSGTHTPENQDIKQDSVIQRCEREITPDFMVFDDEEQDQDTFKERICQTEVKKKYPRRSIAQWHNQRTKNNMSVKDLVKTLEKV